MSTTTKVILVALAGLAVIAGLELAGRYAEPEIPTPDQPCPGPGPCPAPDPKKPKRPWGPRQEPARVADKAPADWRTDGVTRRGTFQAVVPSWAAALPAGGKVGASSMDGVEISCDFPGSRHRRNTESKGLGLCVFTSIHHAADWQNIPGLIDFPKWMRDKGIPGGGYPEKVAKLIPQICQERGVPTPEYFQVESNDLEVLKAACASGRMPGVTYSFSPTGRYGGKRISHMVNLVHADDKGNWVILDNNFPGEDKYEWLTTQEFLKTYSGGGTGWSVIFADPPPPPPPFNRGKAARPPLRAKSACPDGDSCDERGCGCGCRQGGKCTCGDGELSWRRWNAGDDSRWSLYRDGKEVGYWDAASGNYYRRLAGGSYEGTPSEPPKAPPTGWQRTGVVWKHVGTEPTFRHNGHVVSREDVLMAISGVPADAKKHRVTFVGTPEEQARVLADWSADPAISKVKDAFVFRAYSPEHWHVKGYGFAPGLTVTDSEGAELHYAKNYAGARSVAETLRRLRPDYVPGGGSLPEGEIPWCPLFALGAVALVAFLVLRRRNS